MTRRAGATRADAGRLRQLLGEAAGGGQLRPAQSAGAPQLMVRILADIAAGDYSQHDAAIMTISGSTLTDTLQRVKVRHVGEGLVATGTIVFRSCAASMASRLFGPATASRQLESVFSGSQSWSAQSPAS